MALTGSEFRGPLGLVVDSTGALVTVASGSSMGSVVAGWLTDADGRLVTASSGLVFPGPIPGIPCSPSGAVVTGASDGTPFGSRVPGYLTNASGALATGSGPVTSRLGGLARNASGALVTAAGGGSAYNSAVLADSPVAFWPLNETTGTVANDLSASANGGTYTGGFTLNQTGPCSDGQGAPLFDGTTGWVNMGDKAPFRSAQPFSVEAWVNPTDFSNYNMAVSKSFSNYEFQINTTNGFLTFYEGGTSKATTLAPATGAFTHCVWTDGGTTLTLYVNGASVFTAASTPLATSSASLQVGARTGTFPFKGKLAKIALYNYVLSPVQVAAHYAAR